MFNTIYSALYGSVYPFAGFGKQHVRAMVPDELTDKDSALIIWGGSDINPKLYGHPQSVTTHVYQDRDNKEWALLNRAVEMGITIIGVCRGAQMLCARAGGYLLQDVRNHAGRGHLCEAKDGSVFQVNTIHHQMMAGLEKVDHVLLAWAKENLSPKYVYKNDIEFTPPEDWREPEYVYFPKIKGHAIQWHPEGMAENSEATQFVFNQIKERG